MEIDQLKEFNSPLDSDHLTHLCMLDSNHLTKLLCMPTISPIVHQPTTCTYSQFQLSGHCFPIPFLINCVCRHISNQRKARISILLITGKRTGLITRNIVTGADYIAPCTNVQCTMVITLNYAPMYNDGDYMSNNDYRSAPPSPDCI